MSLKALFILALTIAAVYTSDEPEYMRKRRLEIERVQARTHKHNENKSRRLGSWRKMEIFFDTTSLESDLRSQGASNRIPFYKKVMNATGAWWAGALKVNDDRSRIAGEISRNASRYSRELGFNMGGKRVGNYDLLIRVFLCPNKGQALAYAGPFLRHPESKRPITGTVCILPYGDSNFKRAEDSVNRGAGTVIHEFGHIIAFISFDNYQRDNIKVKSSLNRYVWTGANVLRVAREFYGCRSLDGVPLQNNNGKLGGHWSEVYLANELMTPTTGAEAESVSPMTLALCEDTKWYKADYTFSESYTHGKGEGCSHFSSGCPRNAPCRSGTSGFVTTDCKGVGYCSNDNRNCPVERKYSNRDCAKAAGWSSSDANYGASYGGNCAIFKGAFKRKSGRYVYTSKMLSLQATCTSSNAAVKVLFKRVNGSRDVTVTCTSSGSKSFSLDGQSSTIECPNPRDFCKARFGGVKHCDETCNKNGRCQNKGFSRRRRLSAVERMLGNCPGDGTPVTISTVSTGSNGTTRTVATNFGTDASGQKWACWCYSNFGVRTACGDLDEDKDGEGY